MGKNKKDKSKAHKIVANAGNKSPADHQGPRCKAPVDRGRRRVADPSSALRKIYDSRQTLSTGDVLEQLGQVAANLGEAGWMHPVDVEVFWLILGDQCIKEYIADEHLRIVCRLMERHKMYQQVGNCLRNIVELDVEKSGKKLKVEYLLRAVCYTTFQVLTVVESSTVLIRNNYFSELFNSMLDPNVQELDIDPDVTQMLETTHEMFSGSESSGDSGVEMSDLAFQQQLDLTVAETEAVSLLPPDLITDWNIVPTKEDVCHTGQVFLRRNLIRNPFPDLETYLDIHFRLLLEDFMHPTREGILKKLFPDGEQASGGSTGVRIYEQVTFWRGGFNYNPRLIPERPSSWRYYNVKFQRLPKVNWEVSRRLIHGTLVFLWDGAEELIVATVVNGNSKDLAEGKVTLALETQQLPLNFLEKVYVMLESVAFFEPYRAVLQVLQGFTYETFPMLEHFLGWEKEAMPPAYLQPSSVYTLRNAKNEEVIVYSPMELFSWPPADQLGLDVKQHQALHAALTSRVALVQGPPGTGKTFLALKILNSLLDNKGLWQGQANNEDILKMLRVSDRSGSDNYCNWKAKNKYFWKGNGSRWRDNRSPVLVICLTNHALDQFLEQMLHTTDRIIRIGGQSKSPVLDKYNLSEVKNAAMNTQRCGPYTATNYFYYFYQMKEVRDRMDVLAKSIQQKMRDMYAEILEVPELKKKNVISAEVCEAFEEAEKRQAKRKHKKINILKWWLGWDNLRQLLKVLRQLKISVHSQAATEARKSQSPGKFNTMTEDFQPDSEEVLDRNGDLIVDDLLNDDEEDFVDDQSEVESAVLPTKYCEEEEEDEDQEALLTCADDGDNEERGLVEFANSQLERMQQIRDRLMAIPDSEELDYVSGEQIMSIPLSQRWLLFASWKREYQSLAFQDLYDTEQDYEECIRMYNELKGNALAALCRPADVVGMTTTGAAKNRLMLEALGAKIVVVEEAAEVLEAHIVSSLTSKCQHLVMIGDHQQLRPSVNAHHLAVDYQLDVSLFERLITGGMQAMRLGVQHRMRPEVARLIVPSIYPNLDNHITVYAHPHVPGVGRDVFFYHHTQPEREEGTSYYNAHEASMALGLAQYLCREQGVPANKITILATYTAQLHQLRNMRSQLKCQALQRIRITVVDNFQGEENDIIILSLVRNNNRNSVGFLKIPNRVCVALSRARNGLYILGNMRLLAGSSPLWTQIEKTLSEHGEIGSEIPLRCDQHHQAFVKVRKPEDFPSGPFCQEVCGALLDCGHGCVKTCHKNAFHTLQCAAVVKRVLPCGHTTEEQCFKSVKGEACYVQVFVQGSCDHLRQVACYQRQHLDSIPCMQPTVKVLPCGHSQTLPCSQDPDPSVCKTEVSVTLECSHVARVLCGLSETNRKTLHTFCKEVVRKKLLCGHVKHLKCREDVAGVGCGALMERELDCGHAVTYPCPGHRTDNFYVPCDAKVDYTMPRCLHTQKGLCSKPPERCLEEVVRRLPCGHEAKALCWMKQVVCHEKVWRTNPDCGHGKMFSCSEPVDFGLCVEPTEIPHPLCEHVVPVPCSIRKDETILRNLPCYTVTPKLLACGHTKDLPCHQAMDDSIACDLMVNRVRPCGHEVIEACSSLELREKCKIDCLAPLECGHFCSLACHDPSTSHICKRNVNKQLGCGHFQEMPCFRPTCKAVCFSPVSIKRSCGHSLKTTCGKLSTAPEDDECRELVEKKLPCGHSQRVACSVPLEEIVCTARYEHVLGCRHSVSTNCGLPLEHRLKLTCKVDIVKTLPCSHQITLHCGSKDAEKPIEKLFCRIMVEKKIPQCNHTAFVECGKKVSKSDCTSNTCSKILPCGHVCPLPCREPCDTKACKQVVFLDGVMLSCGHLLRGPCNLRYAKPEVIEAKKAEESQCNSNCKGKLDCGHRCASKCSECAAAQFHAACAQRCKRSLVCGHKCEAPCKSACPPCKRSCDYRCFHRKCPRSCGDECVVCNEPCLWQCPHARCEHGCNAYCDRKPCDEPCPKILRCGHSCIGLCGEVCPPMCPACSHVKIPDFDKSKRYVYLPECEHWIELERMDEWMGLNAEDDLMSRPIKCPSCPDCGQFVRLSFRYGDLIKSFYEDLISIKLEYGKDKARVKDKAYKELVKLLTKPIMKDCGLVDSLKTIMAGAELHHQLNREKRWDVASQLLVAYHYACLVCDVKKSYVYYEKKNKKNSKNLILDASFTDLLLRKATAVLAVLVKRPNAGQNFYLRLLEDWDRLDLQRQLFVAEKIAQTFQSGRIDPTPLAAASQLLAAGRGLTEEEKTNLCNMLDLYSATFQVSLSSSAKNEIQFVPQLDFDSETWWKCLRPNCETIFPQTRSAYCPECGGGSQEE